MAAHIQQINSNYAANCIFLKFLTGTLCEKCEIIKHFDLLPWIASSQIRADIFIYEGNL